MENTVVLILAGGRGTRLKSVVSDRPKPMAPIQDIPFLHCLISRMKLLGFSKFCLLTGYMHDFIEEYFKDHKMEGVEITYSIEASPLGTAGALRKAIDQLIGDDAVGSFVALNGDSYFGFSKEEMVRCVGFVKQSPEDFLIGLKKMTSPERYGVVDWESDLGPIKGFFEKGEVKGEAFINSGVYIFSKKILNEILKNDFSLENEVFPRLVEKNKLKGISLEGEFIDIGIPEDFQKAQTMVPLPQP
ncbi:MAG: nucleotidyltransferase family protein [Halobacteriovoraceae bacterium]|nr:nucleotidyltransferase family protein [Halobacteriovoraceae bacterium]